MVVVTPIVVPPVVEPRGPSKLLSAALGAAGALLLAGAGALAWRWSWPFRLRVGPGALGEVRPAARMLGPADAAALEATWSLQLAQLRTTGAATADGSAATASGPQVLMDWSLDVDGFQALGVGPSAALGAEKG